MDELQNLSIVGVIECDYLVLDPFESKSLYVISKLQCNCVV
jgi:hypothetical protein